MILSGHQPAYLPWLGQFHKMAISDAFCILDTFAYSKDFVNRNRVKTAQGSCWLSVPVDAHGAKRICDVRIASDSWRRKHMLTIQHAYAKAEYFESYAPAIFDVIAKRHRFLADLTNDLVRLLARALGLDVNFLVASDYDFAGGKSEYVVDMCRKAGASYYVFGAVRKVIWTSPFWRREVSGLFFKSIATRSTGSYTEGSYRFFPWSISCSTRVRAVWRF